MSQIVGPTLRRLRQNKRTRKLVREIRLSSESFLQPVFYAEGLQKREEVPGLPGVYRETEASLLKQTEKDIESGVTGILFFGVPETQSESGFKAEASCRQIELLRKHFGQQLLIGVDVCVCSFTTHGHCGIVSGDGDHVDNSKSVKELAALAVQYAQAGADVVAPSDMMDGRVAAIRAALNHHSLDRTLLMSYAAKFHSNFYGPFRGAANSAPKTQTLSSELADRSTYQIDPARPSDALLSALRDVQEGTDILMVKPGLPYLDILSHLSKEIQRPWAVYEVSGEYAAVEALAQQGLIDAKKGHLESWTAFQRAGADILISYGARHARQWIQEYQG